MYMYIYIYVYIEIITGPCHAACGLRSPTRGPPHHRFLLRRTASPAPPRRVLSTDTLVFQEKLGLCTLPGPALARPNSLPAPSGLGSVYTHPNFSTKSGPLHPMRWTFVERWCSEHIRAHSQEWRSPVCIPPDERRSDDDYFDDVAKPLCSGSFGYPHGLYIPV